MRTSVASTADDLVLRQLRARSALSIRLRVVGNTFALASELATVRHAGNHGHRLSRPLAHAAVGRPIIPAGERTRAVTVGYQRTDQAYRDPRTRRLDLGPLSLRLNAHPLGGSQFTFS